MTLRNWGKKRRQGAMGLNGSNPRYFKFEYFITLKFVCPTVIFPSFFLLFILRFNNFWHCRSFLETLISKSPFLPWVAKYFKIQFLWFNSSHLKIETYSNYNWLFRTIFINVNVLGGKKF